MKRITLEIEDDAYRLLRQEMTAQGLCYGFWNPPMQFLGKLLEHVENGDAHWHVELKSKTDPRP